jgi:hypothetical protein
MIKFETRHYNPLGRMVGTANQGVRIILRNGMTIMGTVEIKEYELGATFVRMGRVRNYYKNLVRNSEWKNRFCENMRIWEDNTNACLAKKCESWLTGFL